MTSFVSLASISNEARLLDMLRRSMPETYLLIQALQLYGVPSGAMTKIVRAIGNVGMGGWGKVTVYIQEKKITSVEGTEKTIIEEGIT